MYNQARFSTSTGVTMGQPLNAWSFKSKKRQEFLNTVTLHLLRATPGGTVPYKKLRSATTGPLSGKFNKIYRRRGISVL